MNVDNKCDGQNCNTCLSNMWFAGHRICFSAKSPNFMHDIKQNDKCNEYNVNLCMAHSK